MYNKLCSNDHRLLPIKIMWMTVQTFCLTRTAHLHKFHNFRAWNVFRCHSWTQIITWIYFFTLRWTCKNCILKVQNLQIMSLLYDQSCVTTYWNFIWLPICWWSFTHDWAQHKRKLVNCCSPPKKHAFWAMCSVNRAKMCDSLGCSYGTKKETFTPFILMKMLHFQNRGRIIFKHDKSEFLIGLN